MLLPPQTLKQRIRFLGRAALTRILHKLPHPKPSTWGTRGNSPKNNVSTAGVGNSKETGGEDLLLSLVQHHPASGRTVGTKATNAIPVTECHCPSHRDCLGVTDVEVPPASLFIEAVTWNTDTFGYFLQKGLWGQPSLCSFPGACWMLAPNSCTR